MKPSVIAVVAALFLATAAYAHDPAAPRVPRIDSLFSGLIQDEDVTLAFQYLRDSLDAALEGREAPPPAALRERAETIGEELKRRGASYGRNVLDVLEAFVRDRAKEAPGLPRPAPPQNIGIGT